MSEKYPFPLPEAIQKDVASIAERLTGNHAFFSHRTPSTRPQIFDSFDNCHTSLMTISHALRVACDDLREMAASNNELDDQSYVLKAIQYALDGALDRMEALIAWGNMTWRFDPVIKGAVDLEPGKESAA